MIKLVRIPKKDLTLTNFLNMQSGVITGWNMSQINMLQIIANITKPYKKGLYSHMVFRECQIQAFRKLRKVQMNRWRH